MGRILISSIELAVGAICIVGALFAWRRASRAASSVLGLAGIAATGHAVASFWRS